MIGDIVGDDAGRLQEVAAGVDQRHVAGAEWRAAVRQHGLQRLPQRRGRDARGPNLAGVYGSKLDADQRLARYWSNDAYLRDAILNPSQHVTAGYAPIMPTYQGQISEDGLIALVEYIKNLQLQLPRSADADHDRLLPNSEGRRGNARSGQQARAHRAGDGEAMSTTIVSLPDQQTATLPKTQLSQQRERPAELAADRRPQADRDPLPDLDHVLLLHRRRVRRPHPAGAADAAA